MTKKVVTFGEVMMRMSPLDNQRFRQSNELKLTFGGGECNVAIGLANLGVSTSFISRFPAHELGQRVVEEIRKFGVETQGIVYGGDRVGLYFLEKGSGVRSSKIIYDRTNSAFSEIKPDMINWKHELKDADWFHWTGITVGISENAAQTCLVGLITAKEMGLKISGDPNYRTNLFSYTQEPHQTLNDFVDLTDLIIANEYDASHLFGMESKAANSDEINTEQFNRFCNQLMAKFPNLQCIATTKRNPISATYNQLTGLLHINGQVFQTRTFDLNPIVDRVGSGDAFMSGLIYGSLFFEDNHQKIIDFAMASACLKHTIPGDANLVSLNEITQFMEGDNSGRIKR